MSDLPPLKQQFSFESSAVRLIDGSVFQPLKEAQRCYIVETECGYRMSGSTWQALYECKNGRFVLLQFSTPMTAYRLRQPVVREASNVIGHEVEPIQATQYLVDGQFPIPELLQPQLQELGKPKRERDRLPISHWNDPKAMISEQKGAATQNVLELLRRIHRSAIDAVQEIEDWSKTDVEWRCTNLTVHLAWRLRDRYLVEHGTWWGTPNSIPPKAVNILGLRWPAGLHEVGQRAIKVLSSQVTEAAMVLNGHESGGLHPTREERKEAQDLLLTNLETIKQQIISLGKLLADSDSGKLAQSVCEESEIKIPLPWRVEAWRLHQTGMLGKDIAKRVKKSEGNVTRAIQEVNAFYGRFGFLPEKTPRRKATSVDPSILDMRSKNAKKSLASEEEE